MPSWKKVITSGSAAALSSLTVTGGITGSLFGTSSWAQNAATASFVLQAVSSSFATNANNIAVTDTTSGTGPYYLVFADGTTGNRTPRVDSATLTFNATTNTLTVPNLAGTSSWATNAQTASFVATAQTASFVTGSNVFGPFGSNSILSASFAVSSSRTVSASFAISSSFSTNASTASIATVASTVTVSTNNENVQFKVPFAATAVSTTGNYGLYQDSEAVFTYNPTINTLTVPNLAGTASWASNALTSSFVTGSNVFGPFGSNSITSASFAVSASRAVSSSFASTSSFLTSNTNAFIQNGNSFGTTALLGTNDNNPLALETNGTTRMYISSLGDVGIGNTGPSEKLDVEGNIYANGYIQGISAIVSDQSGVSTFGSNSGTRSIRVGRAGTSNDIFITGSSGNVGIGTTTPNAKLDVSGSAIVTGSLTVTNGITGSLFGTSSWAISASNATTASYVLQAVSASFASTASYVNTLNQNVLITGSATIASTTAGASENTLTLGPSPAGGTGEGGQLGLNAVGGTYTSASFIDNWQNHIRILRGTNASSDGLIAQWNLQSKQMNLSGYISPTAIPGTVSGLLAFDTSGNIITTTTGSGGGGVTINNNVDNYIVTATGTANTLNGESGLQYNGTSLAVTGQVTASGAIISTANGAMYFRGGDDAEFWDINVANTVGIYGQQNADRAGLKLGSSGPTLFGSASNLGIGTITPTSASLTVNGNVWATSFTGSLFGTASYATQALSASFATTASYALTASNVQGGTANFIPIWNTATSLSSSTIYQSAGNIGIQNTSSVYPLTVGTNTAGGGSDFTVQTNSNAAKVVLSSQTSNAQIGANPQGSYFNGMPPGASFGSSTAGARTTIGSTLTSAGGGTYINFSTNGANTGLHVTHNYGSDLMTVLSSGNVGLNTTTPNAILDVNGNAIVTGSLTVTNGITGSLFGTASWALNALTSSFVTTAQTASFVTGSNVYGPFGSNSIISASYAVSASTSTTASYALTSSYNINPTVSGSISNVDYIDFNTGSATPAWKSGRIFWDNTEGALSVYNSEADITLQVGQENWTRIFNDSGATIANGAPVRIIGTHGDHPEVVLAASVQVSGSSNLVNQILGLATHAIEDGTFGYVTTQGLVRGLDTSAYNDGDTLYLSSSAGQLTSTVPSAPYEIVPVGQVVKASPGGSGIIYVAVQQPLDFTDLSSVYLGGGTYTDGDIWTYNGPQKRWEHKKQLSGSYGLTGSINIIGGGVTGSLFGTSSWAVTASNAQSASNFVVTNTLALDATLIDYASVNPTVSGVNTIYTQVTGSYTSAFMKYSVSSGSNTRAGEFMTAWNGTNIVYTDTSTTDIGTTAGISFTSSIVSSQLRVSASCTTAGWNIKTLSTFI